MSVPWLFLSTAVISPYPNWSDYCDSWKGLQPEELRLTEEHYNRGSSIIDASMMLRRAATRPMFYIVQSGLQSGRDYKYRTLHSTATPNCGLARTPPILRAAVPSFPRGLGTRI
jgi:hypothetical protein